MLRHAVLKTIPHPLDKTQILEAFVMSSNLDDNAYFYNWQLRVNSKQFVREREQEATL
jgi:hypothetical protein